MINYDSILSAFDGKPTLLQWLKMVKKALDESVLKDITLKQDGANVVFMFNFEDGTSISTPAVTLPKGDTGAKGDKGDKGEQGVSVTGVDEVSNEVVGGQTLTTLRFNFSNGTNNEVVVHAENGKNGGGKKYYHRVSVGFFGANIPQNEIRTWLSFILDTPDKINSIKGLRNKCVTFFTNVEVGGPPTCYMATIGDLPISGNRTIKLYVYKTYPGDYINDKETYILDDLEDSADDKRFEDEVHEM